MKKLLSILILLLTLVQGVWADVTISSAEEWNTFATNVSNGTTYSGETVTLTANLNGITMMAGTSENPFKGTFDGQGYTLTLNINGTPAALFAALSGATIKNLNLTGSITTNGMRPASITSFVTGNSTITNCKSSVAITSSYASDIDAGGFVGRVNEDKKLTMEGCVFTGSINYGTGGYEGGGLVGWTQKNATSTLTYCVFAPSAITITDWTTMPFNMFANGHSGSTISISDCFYNDVAAGKIGTPGIVTQGNPIPTAISSNNDWEGFAKVVSSGYDYSGKTVPLNANITVSTMAGMIERPFSGTFDGQGNTLTANITVTTTDEDAPAAPFVALSGATIKNLNIEGSITTNRNFPASIASFVSGNSTITNCKSSVALTSSFPGGTIFAGGFVSLVEKGILITMEGCVFTGSISYTDVSGYGGGGLVGRTYYGNSRATLRNCLFAPTSVYFHQRNNANFYTFVGAPIGYVNLTNCYYSSNVVNNSNIVKEQGKLMSTISAGNDVTSLAISGDATATYNVSGITVYDKGFRFDDKYYASNGDEIPLSLSHADTPAGQAFSHYTVAGGGSLTAQTETSATLSMSDANQVINTVWTTPRDVTWDDTDEEKSNWTIAPVSPVAAGAAVTATYKGSRHVKSVTYRPVPTIGGKFTINASGNKVYFAKGNLRYVSGTWSFFDHQYDYYSSYSADAWDKFCWVGESGILASETPDKWGVNTSVQVADYGTVVNEDLASDWGNVPGIVTGWRTLSWDEWDYLLSTRTVNGGRGAGYSYTLDQSVNNTPGSVLYPDDYTGAPYTTGANWADFEAAGCVFLPAAGWRHSTSVGVIGTDGRYWSSTASTPEGYACCLSLESDGYSKAVCARYYGSCIRLVFPAE